MELELLSVLAESTGKAYPTEELNRMWEMILTNQFHDILPGSSIHEVYEQTKKEYAEIAETSAKLIGERMEALCGTKDESVTVWNTLGHRRNDVVALGETAAEAMTDGTIPPELHEKYLKIILFETERLTDLTQDLLTLNEFDTNHLLLNREVFDIHEMIKHVAASFEGVCTQKKISIELVFATKHLNVNADKRKIQQVLYNLLDNAIKFSDPNSIVTIETTDRGEKVYTSVKDNGMGIPRSALGKIWERFYKSDLSRGKDKKGTGLGLAIVKEAIQAHGENITVVSTEGVGTEFSFSLPKVAG